MMFIPLEHRNKFTPLSLGDIVRTHYGSAIIVKLRKKRVTIEYSSGSRYKVGYDEEVVAKWARDKIATMEETLLRKHKLDLELQDALERYYETVDSSRRANCEIEYVEWCKNNWKNHAFCAASPKTEVCDTSKQDATEMDDPLFLVTHNAPGQYADCCDFLTAMFVRAANHSDAMDIASQRKHDWKRDFMCPIMCKDNGEVYDLS